MLTEYSVGAIASAPGYQGIVLGCAKSNARSPNGSLKKIEAYQPLHGLFFSYFISIISYTRMHKCRRTWRYEDRGHVHASTLWHVPLHARLPLFVVLKAVVL